MKPLATFKVRPNLPEPLQGLSTLAHNLRWSWDHAAIDLFRRLDDQLWESSGHNPVLLLGAVEQATLESAAKDDSFLAHLKGVEQKLAVYLGGEGSWYRREHPKEDKLLVAYFSAEFGITECLSIFAGGLGVLAGDHVKAASDLGLPLVGVGLLYQQGYFHQYLNAAGWQQEAYEDNDFHTLPVELVPNLTVQVALPDGSVTAQVWCARVGRLKLFLLDTNIPANKSEFRKITHQLYGGDLEMRMRQEILLGIGGYRALEAMGLEPTVYHMNEGHSAFLSLERVRRLMQMRQMSFHEARVLASASLIFTTHTPVAAGHDYFPSALIERYFSDFARELSISTSEFMALGRQNPANHSEDFCMTVLALRLASSSNGVSKLHGRVSRGMWKQIWNGVPEEEIPIGHVTNGVHFRSWVSLEMNQLYDRYLGPKWREEPADANLWKRAQSIPGVELWKTHERRRERLVAYARKCLREQLRKRNAPQTTIDSADEVLSPDALTIGFGRRFASYKRANLLIRDPERLLRLLNDPQRPVQILYAGKAHPHDNLGKELIQSLIELANRPAFRSKLVFLENYDMAVARYMVQGCDVWLNTPLRPLEASGTSGMKAQANGVLNLSTLDGWWDEAWQMGRDQGVDVGWSIGNGETYSDSEYQVQVEAEALYETLEREIVPTFYDRRADGVPTKWVARMKTSIATLCPEFNMHRMVMEYANDRYLSADHRYRVLDEDNGTKSRHYATWLERTREAWPFLEIVSVQSDLDEVGLGEQLEISAHVRLNRLTPDDVSVEVLTGRVTADSEISNPMTTPMVVTSQDGQGGYTYRCYYQQIAGSGMYGYAIRILPRYGEASTPLIPGLICWASCQPSAKPGNAFTARSGGD
ncbi:MAG: alpha-glucan family phosphorylase [Acidobacteria bacterium]|nr:alpha-glucan family phosphorylase [Acidobacteriota bacterium]